MKEQMIEAGKQHAADGKKNTPYECRAIDMVLCAESKNQERPLEWYAEMRAAFNSAWEAEYFETLEASK